MGGDRAAATLGPNQNQKEPLPPTGPLNKGPFVSCVGRHREGGSASKGVRGGKRRAYPDARSDRRQGDREQAVYNEPHLKNWGGKQVCLFHGLGRCNDFSTNPACLAKIRLILAGQARQMPKLPAKRLQTPQEAAKKSRWPSHDGKRERFSKSVCRQNHDQKYKKPCSCNGLG